MIRFIANSLFPYVLHKHFLTLLFMMFKSGSGIGSSTIFELKLENWNNSKSNVCKTYDLIIFIKIA